MLASIIVVGLFILGLQLGQGDASNFIVSQVAAIAAGVTAVFSLVVYITQPKKYMKRLVWFIYIMLAATVALVIIQSGGLSSPFLALWLLVTIFAGLFDWYGLLPIFAASHIYLFIRVEIEKNTISRDALVLFVLTVELPLIVSYLIWRRKNVNDNDKQKAFDAMAQELSQVANKSEIVINAIADGVIALDSRGTIQLINPAAQNIMGWTKQDAMGLDYHSALKLIDKNGKEVAGQTDPIQEVLRTGLSKVDNSLTLTTRSGKQILLSLLISPLGSTPGSGAITVFRDITSEKAEERQQAEFISTASHEMRTPVATIEGYLGLALNPATATIDDKARSYLGKAHESAEHLGRLFQDLLDVAKAEDGRLKSDPTIIDVVAFMRDIVIGLASKAQAKGLILYYKPSSGTTGVRQVAPVFYTKVDKDQLSEITGNLVENAIKYTNQGSVTVDVKGNDSHVQIIIHDTGIGIPREDQVHLFQKFYRVDNSATREIGGTGLGLYLSRRLAEAMGGKISLDSDFGKGSTFTLELSRLNHADAIAEIEKKGEVPEATPQIIPQIQSVPLPAAPAAQTYPAPPIDPMLRSAPPVPAANRPESAPTIPQRQVSQSTLQ